MHAEPERRHIEVARVMKTVRKFVDGRGGYCYEGNSGFHWLLTKLGYEVSMLNGIVAHPATAFADRGPDELPKDFDHMCLHVRFPEKGEAYLSDVAFGGRGALEPLKLGQDGNPQPKRLLTNLLGAPHKTAPLPGSLVEQDQGTKQYMTVPLGSDPSVMTWKTGFEPMVYKILDPMSGQWNNCYNYNLQPQEHEAFQETATWEQTAPGSPFTKGLLCTMPCAFLNRADLAARLACAPEQIDFAEGVDDQAPGHCQLSVTGSFARGA